MQDHIDYKLLCEFQLQLHRAKLNKHVINVFLKKICTMFSVLRNKNIDASCCRTGFVSLSIAICNRPYRPIFPPFKKITLYYTIS